ncbi:MAG: diphosphomevalonate decarboxylase [Myxococcota bacterium]
MNPVSAIAHTNIALIKYWGKAQQQNNLPATGSLSLTLDAFYTKTTLSLAESDSLILDGQAESGERFYRVAQFLGHLRLLSGKSFKCAVASENHVPTSAGLASSASGFAALALAGAKFFGLDLDGKALSELARIGSGSAARSIFPGLARMHTAGYAEPVLDAPLDLCLVVVSCSRKQKAIDSREAMNLTAQTSPYYPAWVSTHQADLDGALAAIQAGDFDALGRLVEHSTLKMHASLMAAQPGLWYFEPLSLTVMAAVHSLRQQGLPAYFTLDAGPHVKVLCEQKNAEALQRELSNIVGVSGVTLAGPGPGAYLL